MRCAECLVIFEHDEDVPMIDALGGKYDGKAKRKDLPNPPASIEPGPGGSCTGGNHRERKVNISG